MRNRQQERKAMSVLTQTLNQIASKPRRRKVVEETPKPAPTDNRTLAEMIRAKGKKKGVDVSLGRSKVRKGASQPVVLAKSVVPGDQSMSPSDRRELIVEMLSRRPLTFRELMELTGFDRKTLANALYRLSRADGPLAKPRTNRPYHLKGDAVAAKAALQPLPKKAAKVAPKPMVKATAPTVENVSGTGAVAGEEPGASPSRVNQTKAVAKVVVGAEMAAPSAVISMPVEPDLQIKAGVKGVAAIAGSAVVRGDVPVAIAEILLRAAREVQELRVGGLKHGQVLVLSVGRV